MVYKLLRFFFKKFVLFFYPKVVKKRYLSNYILNYETAQHLNFFFKSTISYEPNIQTILKKYIKKGDIIFDVGANIGQFAIFFHHLVSNSGNIISVEPDPINFKYLSINKEINKLKNLRIINCGLGSKKGTLNFYQDLNTGGRMGTFVKEYAMSYDYSSIKKINIKTLDELINEFGLPNFVKVDVEGFEVSLLEGYKNINEKTIFMIEVREKTKYKVFNFFKEKKYKCLMIDNNETLVSNHNQIPNFANLLFIPKK